jgi:hypothetical protein
MKILTFALILSVSSLGSTLNATSAKADTVALESPSMYYLDVLCKSQHDNTWYAKNLNQYSATCGYGNGEETSLFPGQICNVRFGSSNISNYWYEADQFMCYGNALTPNHGKGSNTIGGAQENPWWNPWGW